MEKGEQADMEDVTGEVVGHGEVLRLRGGAVVEEIDDDVEEDGEDELQATDTAVGVDEEMDRLGEDLFYGRLTARRTSTHMLNSSYNPRDA